MLISAYLIVYCHFALSSIFSVLFAFFSFLSLSDFLARMGVWNLDGVVWHSQLLPFVLNESNICDTIAMIVVDLSQPWGILESLERWIGVLNKHTNSLNVPGKLRKEMEENSQSRKHLG